MTKNEFYFNRELSWLSFNYRVLQEAKDTSVPLLERLRFIAIYSSNLDEFFRIRVAALDSLQELSKRNLRKIDFEPTKVLNKINKLVEEHQLEFNKVFREELVPELRKHNIFILNESNLNKHEIQYLANFFTEKIESHIKPINILASENFQLENKQIYLAVQLHHKPLLEISNQSEVLPEHTDDTHYYIVEIPTQVQGRFVMLPGKENEYRVILLDDVVRLMLPKIFKDYYIDGSYCIKLTRDAELDLGDEFEGNLIDKVKKSLAKRKIGLPSRFLHDLRLPEEMLRILRKKLNLVKDNIIAGGRYHNFSDFLNFPVTDIKGLVNEDMPPITVKELDEAPSMFKVMDEKDTLLYYPYHDYGYVVRLINEAANDPAVTSIYITLYRVARKSAVVQALLLAIENKKKVIVFDEIKARFDEESNIYWAERLEKAGGKVLYSIPELKVHAKMLLIKRTVNNRNKNYVYLSTGNFNERTSRLYTDFGLFTSDSKLTREVDYEFEILQDMRKKREFKHLLVAPDFMRKDLFNLIDHEIKNHLKGKPAGIMMKLNNLEDRELINKLYEASQDGVTIKLIVRSACCLIPGIPKLSDNIEVISIIDRFLEHARVLVFRNTGNGNEKIYLSSADMMNRNLSRRIEVAFPVYDKRLKKTILDILQLQLNDNVKARIIDKHQQNEYKEVKAAIALRAQTEIYTYLQTNDSSTQGKSKVPQAQQAQVNS